VIASNDAWAVGSQNLSQTVTEHWDGKAWSLVPSPNPSPNDTLAAVAGTGAGQRLWAVGNQIPSSQYQNLILVTTA
jgi:hypothetical protein